ncbi:hypothetical protein ACFQ1S_29020, partial [Kibdelosporangium lantanae]
MDTLLSEPPTCVNDLGTLCRTVFEWTHNAWLSGVVAWLAKAPLRILLIIVIALVVRALLRRTIDRLALLRAEYDFVLQPKVDGYGYTPRQVAP